MRHCAGMFRPNLQNVESTFSDARQIGQKIPEMPWKTEGFPSCIEYWRICPPGDSVFPIVPVISKICSRDRPGRSASRDISGEMPRILLICSRCFSCRHVRPIEARPRPMCTVKISAGDVPERARTTKFGLDRSGRSGDRRRSEFIEAEIQSKCSENVISTSVRNLGTLLPLVVPPIISQMVLWTIWLVVLCSFKIFQSLANDRLERLFTSPSVKPSKYLRIFSALLLVLVADLFWQRLCMLAYTYFGSSLFLLSFFEPLNIAFETLLALTVHGFHLIEIWQRHSIDNEAYCLASLDFYKSIEGAKFFYFQLYITYGDVIDLLEFVLCSKQCLRPRSCRKQERSRRELLQQLTCSLLVGVSHSEEKAKAALRLQSGRREEEESDVGRCLVGLEAEDEELQSTGDKEEVAAAAGSLEEWKGLLNRNCGFLLDFVALLMSVGHYLMIWWLQGMAFDLANAVLFLYLYHSLIAMVKRVRGFIKLNNASISLGEELPDATNKELSAYDDQCAICRGQMTKAKKLPCNHLFHLACLKSWLDQGWTEAYSCPTCRALLFVSSSQNQMKSFARQISNDVHIAESIELVLHHQRMSGYSPPAVVSLQPSTEPS
ncbi:E3 ubiquitin protein ligase RIN3 [Dendrobium catenatum]|uniref:E3 ubiquitin protein ligase RIN3 n=1 Tax=Dendrobium catenatum TaxID=906689 RepID=UPI0010A00FA8|nr:E3 ubiquitin protein ligase RIN3 [Dendrobium catenatum]